MAEVAQNEDEKNMNGVERSKNKQNASALKQCKISFIPRKPVMPTFVKVEKKTENNVEAKSASCVRDANENCNNVIMPNESKQNEKVNEANMAKGEKNGVLGLHSGKKRSEHKKAKISEKLLTSPKVSLVQLKLDKVTDQISKSSKSVKSDVKSSKSEAKSASKCKNSKVDSKSKSGNMKKQTVSTEKHAAKTKTVKPSKKLAGKASKPANSSTGNDGTKEHTPNQSPGNENNSSLHSSKLVNSDNFKSPVVLVESSDEEEELSLAQLKKQITPVKLNDYASKHGTNKSNKTNMNQLKKNTSLTSIASVKLVDALSKRKTQPNGPSAKPTSALPMKSEPPRLNPLQTKNIIIAIDMDPKKWKALSPQEQNRIIEQKKEIARKQLMSLNSNQLSMDRVKLPPGIGNHNLQKQNHISMVNKVPTLMSPTTVNSAFHLTKITRPVNSLLINRYMSPRIPASHSLHSNVHPFGPRLPIIPLQQGGDFNNQFHQKQDESSLTNLQPLPPSKPIPVPPGFPNEKFGEIAMIVEFVNTFKSFLMCDTTITSDMLLAGVCCGSKKVNVVANVLYMFLKVLLSREDFKVRGLKMELADLPLTEFTVSFLVCQLIKSHMQQYRVKQMEDKAARNDKRCRDNYLDDGQESGSDDDYDPYGEMCDDGNSDNEKKKRKKGDCFPANSQEFKLNRIYLSLERKEFWMLETSDQILVLTYLLNLILDSEEFTDYYDELNEEKSEAYREIDKLRKSKAKLRMDQAVITLDQFTKPIEKDGSCNNDKKNGENPINTDNSSESTSGEPKIESKPDPYAGMTQRQIEAIKSEKDKLERKKKEKDRLEMEEMNKRQEKCMVKLNKITDLTKRAMRMEPLGEDRYHRMYWFFPETLPGLYVSSVTGPFPSNLNVSKENWSYYNKEEDINQLLCALTVRGIREDKLKYRIRNNHMAIVASIRKLDNEQVKKEEYHKTSSSQLKGDEKSAEKDANDRKDKDKEESDTKKNIEASKKNENEMPLDEEVQCKDSEKVKGIEEKEEDKQKIGKDGEKNEEEDKAEGNEEKAKANEEKEKVNEEKAKVNEEKAKANEEKAKANEEKAEANGEKAKANEEKEEVASRDNEKEEDYDAHKCSIEALKTDIIESANRIVHGSLGELIDLETWIARVSTVNDVQSLKEFVLQIQSCIFAKFFLPPFNSSKDNISKEWCKWVEKAETLSTLHMLYGLLENSIKWESSAENMRCKICRRKKGSEYIGQIIVCDGCQMGYHSHCLRPPLDYIPNGDWKCPSCMTEEEKYCAKSKNSRNKMEDEGEDSGSDESGDEGAESNHEEVCHVCESDGLMILCDTCPFSYHLECHKPPLHHTPRGQWSCYECTKTQKKSKNGTYVQDGKRRRIGRSKYVEVSSSMAESSDNSDSLNSSDEFQEKNKKGVKKKKGEKSAKLKETKHKRNYKKRKLALVSSSNDESSAQLSEDEGVKRNKKKSKRGKKNIETDECPTGSNGSSKSHKRRILSTDNEEDINSDNFKMKIEKYNYKGRNRKGKRPVLDNEPGTVEGNSPPKGNKSDSFSNGDTVDEKDWGKPDVSPTLGNKRPRYAKDGLKDVKESAEKVSSNSSMDTKSDSESSKSKEVQRNLSSAHREFRQAGRNNRRRCNYEMQACTDILVALRKHKDAWPFLQPVNPKQAPDYSNIIERPIDFSIILKSLNEFAYDDVLQFLDDVKLVFENAKKYNLDTSDVGQAGARLNEEFQLLLKTHLPEVYSTFE